MPLCTTQGVQPYCNLQRHCACPCLAAAFVGQCTVRIWSPSSNDYINMREIELYGSSGTQLPSSSLTIFASSYWEEVAFPG